MSMDLAKKTFSTQPDYLIAGNAGDRYGSQGGIRCLEVRRSRGSQQRRQAGRHQRERQQCPYTVTTTACTAFWRRMSRRADGIVYLSGEFFADALVLPANATAVDVEVPLRNLGIYLK